MRQLLTAITPSPMSKMKVMPSICIAFVLVRAMLSLSAFEGISLNQSSYFE